MKSSELFKEKVGHDFIYNIVHIDNLVSILKYGILSYNKCKQMKHTSVADPNVQCNREIKKVTNSLPLHDFANCYFNPRNPMMYKLKMNMGNDFKNIIILAINSDILNREDTVIADRNATASTVAFMPVPEAIEKINFNLIYLNSWDHPDPEEKYKLKLLISAEVLVPYKIDVSYIAGIIVSNAEIKDALKKIVSNNIPITINKNMFFQGGC